jgi:hypothetical protein
MKELIASFIIEHHAALRSKTTILLNWTKGSLRRVMFRDQLVTRLAEFLVAPSIVENLSVYSSHIA